MIKLTTDSVCDLGEFIEKRGIEVLQLPQGGDGHAYPDESAYVEFFARQLDGADCVIHICGVSDESLASLCAKRAAKEFGERVFIIDSRMFAGGKGLLLAKAADYRDGGMRAEELVSKINVMASKVVAVFLLENAEMLYARGRCSRTKRNLSRLFKSHPHLGISDGQLNWEKSYRGTMKKSIASCLEELALQYSEYDNSRCVIAHTAEDESLIGEAKAHLKEKFAFKETMIVPADAVGAQYCGKNTIGFIFISE